jgi:hypothetical protein
MALSGFIRVNKAVRIRGMFRGVRVARGVRVILGLLGLY